MALALAMLVQQRLRFRHQEEGKAKVVVQKMHEGELKIRLACGVCGVELSLADCVLAFGSPPIGVRGMAIWAHPRCIQGRKVVLFGTPLVVTMAGAEAMKRLAYGLEARREGAAD
jgi:hypothetical protein